MPRNADRPRRITAERDGPLLIEGPVEVALPNGEVVISKRFVVAVCTCRRSRTYPWCDTSHRARTASAGAEPSPGEPEAATTDEGSHP
ncbi:CDGSH iron-sulfur domain-containing protein [Embleya scabrispora]|uniref:CDGSH iron-sulfur domain-containing protein n=1 Tax=Embleya scabrispora TaxID=159449 RepID=UPI000399E2AE|nr:CDGSH iron-sulfur domain-containing protein [Embleya scabrispora]MYS86231.1 CDGSH iron-sulfur domain-containing protein [Streptomyces sp. SID5474]